MNYATISLFSGAMGLDLGLELAGLNICMAQDFDRACVATANANNRVMLGGSIVDILSQDPTCNILLSMANTIREEVFAVVGGPPCQSWSTMGKRLGFEDPRGLLVWSFFQVIDAIRPRFFIMENVKGLYFSPGREAVIDKAQELGYHVVDGILDAVDFGVPQFRERFILIGSRDNEPIFLPRPTHFQTHQCSAMRWRKLRDALENLEEGCQTYMRFSPNRVSLLDKIPPGGNWRNLDACDALAGMGKALTSGGGKTGFFRRLSWEEPSPTLTTSPAQKSTMLCHPEYSRPLSVQEYARIQQFPDDWKFAGQLNQKYRQIGNAVPVGLAKALGDVLISVTEQSHMVVSKRKRGA